jgi:hydroxymethylpyrimidine kinase/phosphomethylpyrimidine kinase
VTLWLVGGIDPTGGAGLARDEQTARTAAPELAIATVTTAQTRQGHGAPASAQPIDAAALRAALSELPDPIAVKIGLVPDACVAIVLEAIAARTVPVVVDPVMRASDGGDLGASAQGLLPLARVATLLTPNLAEAHALLLALGHRSIGALTECAHALSESLHVAVLVKGGHDDDPTRVCDVLARQGRVQSLARPRVPRSDPRGTGCALATAIACGLARGDELSAAVVDAVQWLDGQRARARPGADGRAHLPPDGPPLPSGVHRDQAR